MLDAAIPESGFLHPSNAVGTCVVEPTRGLDQHVQAHQQAKGILAPLVINDGVIDDYGPAFGQSGISLLEQHSLRHQIPVVQDVAKKQHVGGGKIIGEKAAANELHTVGDSIVSDVFLKHWTDLGQIKTRAFQMRLSERNLRDEISLSGADIGAGLIASPGKLLRDGQIRASADAGHGTEELAQPGGVGVNGGKRIGASLGFILRCTRAHGSGEVSPETVEAMIGHLEYASDVGGLGLVEKEVRLRRVLINAINPLEEA